MAPMENVVWRKSSRSGGTNGDCVELAYAGLVRDSKNPNTNLAVDLNGLIIAAKADRFAR
jgi:hypothetical protein